MGRRLANRDETEVLRTASKRPWRLRRRVVSIFRGMAFGERDSLQTAGEGVERDVDARHDGGGVCRRDRGGGEMEDVIEILVRFLLESCPQFWVKSAHVRPGSVPCAAETEDCNSQKFNIASERLQ